MQAYLDVAFKIVEERTVNCLRILSQVYVPDLKSRLGLAHRFKVVQRAMEHAILVMQSSCDRSH